MLYVFLEEIIRQVLPLISFVFTVLYGIASYLNWNAPQKDKIRLSAIALGHPYTGLLLFLIVDSYFIVRFCITGSFS